MPNGSRLGRTGAGLQPSFFASAACLDLVITAVRILYSTMATIGTKTNVVAERILSASGAQVATRTRLVFFERMEMAFNIYGKAKHELILFGQLSSCWWQQSKPNAHCKVETDMI